LCRRSLPVVWCKRHAVKHSHLTGQDCSFVALYEFSYWYRTLKWIYTDLYLSSV